MMKWMCLALLLVLLVGCKSKAKKAEVSEADFFPVASYLKGELARLDTALYSFTKIETVGRRSDTTPIRNSEVKDYAKEFMNLPDISSKELKDDYQISHLYDDLLDAFVFTFTTTEAHPVKREDVVLDPQQNEDGKNNIKSVFVDLWQDSAGTPVRRNLFWESGKSFRVVTTRPAAGGQDSVRKVQVLWNGFVTGN